MLHKAPTFRVSSSSPGYPPDKVRHNVGRGHRRHVSASDEKADGVSCLEHGEALTRTFRPEMAGGDGTREPRADNDGIDMFNTPLRHSGLERTFF